MADAKCSARVGYDSYWPSQCSRGATVTRDNKPYCTIHDPEYIKEKQAKKDAKWKAEWTEVRTNADLRDTAIAQCKKVNPDNPQAVAESIQALYEALIHIVRELDKAGIIKADSIFMEMPNKALSQAERKE